MSVSSWNDEVKVHLRQFSDDACGQKIPSKKGIALNLNEFSDLKAQIDLIDDSIRRMISTIVSQQRSSQRYSSNEEGPLLSMNLPATGIDSFNNGMEQVPYTAMDDNANHAWDL